MTNFRHADVFCRYSAVIAVVIAILLVLILIFILILVLAVFILVVLIILVLIVLLTFGHKKSPRFPLIFSAEGGVIIRIY